MRLPPEADEVVRADAALPGLVREVRGWMLSGEPPVDARTRTRFNLAVRERLRDRVRHLALLALTPSDADWAAVALPARAWPLYAAVRPFRLARAAARRRR